MTGFGRPSRTHCHGRLHCRGRPHCRGRRRGLSLQSRFGGGKWQPPAQRTPSWRACARHDVIRSAGDRRFQRSSIPTIVDPTDRRSHRSSIPPVVDFHIAQAAKTCGWHCAQAAKASVRHCPEARERLHGCARYHRSRPPSPDENRPRPYGAPYPGAWIQDAQWPARTSRNVGTTSRQSAVAMWHLGWNTHPDGGFNGLGTSPASGMRRR